MDNNYNNGKVRLLFFHNTLPEYRIGWFSNLAEYSDVKFIFTNEKQNKKDYGFDIDYSKAKRLDCYFLSSGIRSFCELKKIMSNIKDYDFVELPPIDTIREVIFSVYIIKICKKNNVKIGYFWEKWDAPVDKQTFGRRVKNCILRIIPGAIYKNADIIFSVGKKNRDYFISNGVKEKKIRWIPDVSETPSCQYVDLRKEYNISKEKKIIMYFGRMLRQKGVSNLIKAYSSLDTEIKNKTFLLIAGDGEEMSLCKSLVKKFEIKNCIFVGSIVPSKRKNYFAQCDIFVYPVTYYKGRVDVWGLTLNEAVQNGKIIIATDAVGSAYELIENGVNGFRIQSDNIEQLKDALINSMDPSIKITAEKKDMILMEKYNYKNMALCYLDEVNSVI